jgi:HlyD family secretion protein
MVNPVSPAHNGEAFALLPSGIACVDSPVNLPAAPQPIPPRAGPRPEPDRQLGQRVRSLRLSHIPDRRITVGTIVGWVILAVVICGATYAIHLAWQSRKAEVAAPPPTAKSPASSESPNAAPADKATAPAISALKSAAPEPAKSEIALESSGHIIPAHQILVSPKVSGMIVMLDIEEGKRVQKGDILAILESTDYEADVTRARALVKLNEEKIRELENGSRPEQIKQAEAELAESQATLVQLESEWRRNFELRRSKSITQQEYELAESGFKSMQQRVQRLSYALELLKLGERVERREIAKAELAQVQADLVKAEWRLGNCTIRAPRSGTILKKAAEEGNVVNPLAQNGSFSLCEMADLSDLEVELNIQERDISAVKVGQKCRVRTKAWPDRVYEGVVSRLMPIADRGKGAVPVRVKLSIPAEEEGVYLKPEMEATVTFLNDVPT